MKTYPLLRDDGALHAFEIDNTIVRMSAILSVLRSVPGVQDVRRTWFKDERVLFTFHGEPFQVWEPWGDSSRYWIGPESPGPSAPDPTPIHDAFRRYQGPVARFLRYVLGSQLRG